MRLLLTRVGSWRNERAAPASEPAPPVTWTTVKVHHRHDVDPLGLNAIQEPVGKLWKQNTSESAAKWSAGGGKFKQSLVRALNREDEIEPEPVGFALVELGCRNELVLCLGMKFNASHRSVARAFLMTVPARTPVTFPDSSSPSRRSASSSQSFSASASDC